MKRAFSLISIVALLCLSSAAAASPAGRVADLRPDQPLAGWVAVESFGGNLAVVALDAAADARPDGVVDRVARFTASEAIAPALYYRGYALVEFGLRTLRIVPLDGSEVLVFSVDQVADNGAEARRLGRGLELVYRQELDVGSVEQVVGELRRENRSGQRRAVTSPFEEEQQDDGSGSGGGCKSSCSTTCAGGGGMCSVSCHPSKCAECECTGEQNLASCKCR